MGGRGTNHESGSWTPEMVEPRSGMEQMTSVQQNRDMNHESQRHDGAPASQPANT